MSDQYEFRDGHFVDAWNIEKYPTEAIDTNTNWFEGQCGSWPEDVLDLCGCGSPDEVVDAMGEYLTRVETGPQPWGENPQIRPGEHHLADLLLAYLANNRKLTEHGGSIYGVWLTDAGKRWLELWRAV